MKTFTITILLFIGSNQFCRSADTTKIIDAFNIKKLETEIDSTSGRIRYLLWEIRESNNLESVRIGRLIHLFWQNERNKKHTFPSSRDDSKLFRDVINLMQNELPIDTLSIELIVRLQLILRRNAELAEFLTETIPKIALRNTMSFVKVYSKLNNEEKDYLDEGFYYFKTKEEKNKFLSNLQNIRDSKLSATANEIIYRIVNAR